MDRFLNVGISKYSDNFIALRVAQDLTNEKAEIFKLVYENCVFEGLIVSVHARNNYFKIQMSDGSKTDRLDIEKLESIEKVSRWNFDFNINKSFKIYVDDIRSVPEGYIGTKSVYETISLIEYIEENGGTIEILDLDHDLGDFASEVEKKQFMQTFIEKIELFPERRADGNWIKNISFKFYVPVVRDGKNSVNVKGITFDKEDNTEGFTPLENLMTLETVVLMSKKNS